jgi:hypothetical protein
MGARWEGIMSTDLMGAAAVARRRERWSWRALPGLVLGAWVSPRRQHELLCDLADIRDYRPQLVNHPRLRRAWLVLGTALWVAWAWAWLILYPFMLPYLAIVYAIDRLRARDASIRARKAGGLGGDRD